GNSTIILLFNNNKIIAINCVAVLNLPQILAAIVILLDAAITLKPVIINSLATTITTIHAETLFKSISIIRAVVANILSANGSKNFPKVVTKFLLLAKYPSIKSVNEATINIIAGIILSV